MTIGWWDERERHEEEENAAANHKKETDKTKIIMELVGSTFSYDLLNRISIILSHKL